MLKQQSIIIYWEKLLTTIEDRFGKNMEKKSSIDMTPSRKSKPRRLYTGLTLCLRILSYIILCIILFTIRIISFKEVNSLEDWLDYCEVFYNLVVPQILSYVLVISLRAIIDLLSRIEYSRRRDN